MFGRAEWFRIGWRGRIRPSTWYGRWYLLVWAAVIGVPTVVLISAGRWPESLIWPLFMAVMWKYEFRPIRAAHRRRDLFVIDDTTDITNAQARRYRPHDGLRPVESYPGSALRSAPG